WSQALLLHLFRPRAPAPASDRRRRSLSQARARAQHNRQPTDRPDLPDPETVNIIPKAVRIACHPTTNRNPQPTAPTPPRQPPPPTYPTSPPSVHVLRCSPIRAEPLTWRGRCTDPRS